MAQQRFWKEFYQLKVQINFVQKLLLQAEQSERMTKMFIAITSSASIGAWVIWKDFALLWGSIIAGSQVLTVIYPYLPYRERHKSYASILRELEMLFIDAEQKWQTVADGSLTNRQIDKERNFLSKKRNDVLNKFLPSSAFPSKPKIADLSEKEAERYFSYFYPQDDGNDLIEALLPAQESSLTKAE